MANNITIRTAILSDLETISNIEKEEFSILEAASLDSFKKRFELFKNNFFVLELDEKVIGFIAGPTINTKVIIDQMYEIPSHNYSNPYLSVFGIAIKKQYQNKGYGSLLMKQYIEYAKRCNCKGIVLASRESKVHFYENLGFLNLGESKSNHGNTKWFDMIYEF